MDHEPPITMDINSLLVYMDDALIAVNKPAGLRVIPDGYNPTLPFLTSLLQNEMGRVWVLHRLDKDTSGIILFAKNPDAHRELNRQFEKREIQKEYHAIAIGMPQWQSTMVTLPLRVNGDRRHRTLIDHQTGKPAETAVEVIQPLGVFALLKAAPHSGYTHQIRAHLAAVDLPILADPLYRSLQPQTQLSKQAAQIASSLPIQRTALHASRISFIHPVNHEAMTLDAPYPEDFSTTLSTLVSIRDSHSV